MNKIWPSVDAALADVFDGATVLFGGFGGAGEATELMAGLLRQGASGLTGVSNSIGKGGSGLAALIRSGRLAKMICSFPLIKGGEAFQEQYRAGRIALETTPQGTLAERLRAGGAGIEAFYTPTGVGTEMAEGKELRSFNGVPCLLEQAIRGDFALVRAHKADRWGNLVYRKTGRNFNPVMAMAARVTIAEVDDIVELGALDPEVIVTPGIFVQRVVRRGG
ncbi:MAG: 3-oxoacid CoA-transferase subunit A, partial [Rhodocyclaceae bacterium]|nr:3-oxoacid CoA-transferase subunit A [Rhodocyclaceae bacterium]